ncbi:nucleic acid-binding, OB-fold protein [Artemisia annua]|uniref:Nucleic acid-binding, OB-fold protein n=1 Tax=Artemisia annua TaxID=35608 RepID=A0A2U1LYM8_ARTAN|nr:nucleic acid-binding, OB-fold protein [Artemisia annua]
MVKMMSNHTGKYTIIPTSMSARYYNGQLGISSCSSTLILVSDDIPAIVNFKAQISNVNDDDDVVPISAENSREGTLDELLALGCDRRKDANVFRCEAEIVTIHTKNCWYYHACGGGKCKKGVTHQEGKLWCNSCNKAVNYPKARFRLEVEIKDDTNQTVVVLWDETATELTKSSAMALLDELEHVFIQANMVYLSMGIEDDSDIEVNDDAPVIVNTTNKDNGGKKRRYIEEDSDTEVPHGGAVQLDKIDIDDAN